MQQGECLSSLAFENGFFWETLWEHPENATLKQTRESPFVLKPGDVVHIPDLRPGEVSAIAGAQHTYRRKGVPARLLLQLLEYDQPLANLPYVLSSGEQEISGTTDADGKIDLYVPPNIPSATLQVGEGTAERVFTITARTLNPMREIDGIQMRLTNLGYYEGAIDGQLNDATITAIKRFQGDHDLEPTGQADDATASALSDLHLGTQ